MPLFYIYGKIGIILTSPQNKTVGIPTVLRFLHYSNSIDECVEICMMEMSNDEDGLQAFYRYAEKRMHREHPEWFKESVNTNVSATDIVNEIQREYGSFTLDEIKADLASDGDADIDDEAGWILQKALIEIANQCEATDEFWIKVQQELELLF